MPRSVELKELDVVVGIVTDTRGRVLIQQRDDGPFAGLWEFPGGKREPGESCAVALARELAEENAIKVTASRPLIRVVHAYPDRVVRLSTFEVTSYAGEVRAAEGQPVRWVSRRALLDEAMLPADRPISVAVNLPDRYLVTPHPDNEEAFLGALDVALLGGVRLVCLRAPGLDDARYESFARLAQRVCARHDAALMLHGGAQRAALVREINCAGLHLTARDATALSRRPLDSDRWLCVSAHSAQELDHAATLGADFAVLGSVGVTPTHPGGKPIGPRGFDALVDQANLPVYAIGGMQVKDIGDIRQRGGQGVAAIRGLWPD